MTLALAAALGLIREVPNFPEPGVMFQDITPALADSDAFLELPADSLRRGQQVVLVDDVLATGGTLLAAGELIRRAGCAVSGVSVLVELDALGGRHHLPWPEVHALMRI